ncbi:hypothetical protein ACU8V4_09885 [Pseudoalteromonas mariniglutinosa]
MHYAIIAFIFSLLVMLSPTSSASNDSFLSSPIWLNLTPQVQLAETQQARYFEAQQTQYLWLAKGQWLELDSNTFNSFIFSSGTSHLAQQRLNLNRDFICEQAKCQLPSVSYNRILKITNHLDEGATLAAMVGETNRHRDSFRRAVKLPRAATRFQYGQNVEHYYHFKAGEAVKLYFPNGKKLKLSVRKDLLNKDRNGKVYAYVNDQPVSIISVIASRASEYKSLQVGLANTDYLAIGKGEYLTINSETDAYIKLEQSHRGIYDDQAMDKLQESLFQPYWVNNLDDTLKTIYLQRDLSQLASSAYQQGDLLAQRRYQDLLSSISSRDFLTPDTQGKVTIKSHFKHFDSLASLRLVDDISYPVLSEEYAPVHTLEQQHHFSLTTKQRVRSTLTLHARSNIDTQLLVTSGNLEWHLTLGKSEHFAAFELQVPLTNTELTIQNLQQQRQPIEYALQSDQLLALPNNELLYAQAGTLKETSSVIESLLNQQVNQIGNEFIDSLVPYNPQYDTEQANTTDTLHWQHQLGEAEYLMATKPLQALQIIKTLVNVTDTDIAIKAWQLRIKILNTQGRTALAKSYHEGLYKSTQNLTLKRYAGNALLLQYQALEQDYKLQGLCANALQLLTPCRDILISLAIKQQKNLLALWLSHDLPATTTLQNSFAKLNWRNYSETTQQQPEYEVEHAGIQTLVSPTGKLSAITVNTTQPLTFKAHTQPLTIALRARSNSVQNGQYKVAWLFAKQAQQQTLLPIFSDVSSANSLLTNAQPLSIASDAVISLKAGESVRLSSDHQTVISYRVLSQPLVSTYHYQNMASHFYWQTPFMALLYDANVSMQDLLNNTLFKLTNKTLTLNEYTQVLAKVKELSLSGQLESLFSRVQSYGEWVPLDDYLDFAGTQLIAIDAQAQTSYSDQLVSASTQETYKQGLVLRPHHDLHIDLSQTQSKQIRLVFNFSAAELSQGNVANVAIKLATTEKVWSVQPGQTNTFGFDKTELTDNLISLQWLNPYLSQVVTLTAQEYRNNRWHDLPLTNNLLFYTVLPEQHLVAQLPADRLVKLEQMLASSEGNGFEQRVERSFFHPAGKVEVSTDKIKYVRLYTWQLSDSNHKVSNFKPEQPINAAVVTYTLAQQTSTLQPEVAQFHPEDLSWQAFINYDRRGIFESSESIATRHSVDIGARLRLTDDENWYRLDLTYSLSEQDNELFSIDAYHSWQDHDTPWYVDSALQTSWQPSQANGDSHYALSTYVQVGQIWRVDESHRHQWQVSPFYSYSSADIEDFLFDPKLNSDIYNFYREDHPSGWRGEYQYRYQPWVDSYFNFLAGSISNADWTSLDMLRFGASWNQYYQGHIFQAGITSYYKFADEDRPISTWQYITSVGWRKQVHLGDFSQGWIKLRWDQDWFRNDHNVSLEFSTGNLADTGFGVFSHDEIIFESLQLDHFLEQN